MRRQAARLILALLFVASLAASGAAVHRVLTLPAGTALVERGLDGAGAQLDRLWARSATPEALTARLQARLAEAPRNWVAIDAMMTAARDEGIALPSEIRAAVAQADRADRGRWASARTCVRCAADAAACPLSQAMLCRLAVDLTVAGDLRDLVREAGNYARGEEVDQIDLALSTAGLGAAALVVVSGGSSAAVKLGAGLAKTAKQVGALSAPLLAMVRADAARLVDWRVIGALSYRDADRLVEVLKGALRAAPARRLGALTGDLGAIRASVGTVAALHLVSSVETAADARRLARAAEARPHRVVATLELAGKSRLTRAVLRWSDEVRDLVLLAAGLAVSAALSALGLGLGWLRRLLRPYLRRAARG
ncbi:hypothetical protein GE300_07970 [Rhodobacteraceae bacterium 2CG4]|uniref:Uncharacterized protein n=1 Tax=Halovulum marinum TaxID=2662447 RepID=A0A6L5YZ05_9RHOB|nr:hypothetical protein [Halovulum marinum]MSU89551.1 hypothetical protein [Halovulum marinum]